MGTVIMSFPLRIGVSASFFHPDPDRKIFKGKRLLYLEEELVHWVMSAGALPVMVPTSAGSISPDDIVHELDGLVLQGGSDVSPESYGETPLRPEWSGDRFRDLYEQALIFACFRRNVPVFGVCRGLQILNVACGGSLYQDIALQVPGAREHRNGDIYDRLRHVVQFEPGSRLAAMYPGPQGEIISIHHQAIKDLGEGLVVEARSVEDGIIEAIRLVRDPAGGEVAPYACGVQWHPEFQKLHETHLLDPAPLLQEFFAEARRRREEREAAPAIAPSTAAR